MASDVIKVLSKALIDKIAAGEVVERPASVVKEFVENALDAGSTAITVEIKNGGITYIRVTDNGVGIPFEQAGLAFSSHATSKICCVDDLYNIGTMGFRGEALSSIASVCDVEMITKERNSETGTSVLAREGHVYDISKVAGIDGTTMIARNLFKNIPARMKFLKKDSTEAKYIWDLVVRFALFNVGIAFKYICDEKLVFYTTGSGDLLEVVFFAYGKKCSENIIKIHYDDLEISVNGCLGNGSIARGNRTWQTLFVNGRYIKNNVISKIVEEAYAGMIRSGVFPFFVLHIGIVDRSSLDVNVHPAKMEIKFGDEKKVYQTIYNAVNTALSSVKVVPNISDSSLIKCVSDDSGIECCKDHDYGSSDGLQDKLNCKQDLIFDQSEMVEVMKNSEILSDQVLNQLPDQTLDEQNHQLGSRELDCKDKICDSGQPKEPETNIRIIGHVFSTYLIIEQGNKMCLIDQHAAHERIKYQQLLHNYNIQNLSQDLLMPQVITLSPIEFDIVMNNLDFCSLIGFEIEDFGNTSIIVNRAPFSIIEDRIDISEIILEIIEVIQGCGKSGKLTKVEQALRKIACTRAIKSNDKLSYDEMRALIGQIESLGNINTCPHGRPIKIYLEKKDLEKFFSRSSKNAPVAWD